MRNDFELFSAIASGDDKSFNILYAKYNNMVFNIAFRYCKSIDTAQDITQYIFLKLWESGSNIVAKGDMRNYLFTMAKNYTINYLRDEQTIGTVEYNVEEHNDLFVSNDLYESNRITEMYDAFCEGLNLLNETKKQICLF